MQETKPHKMGTYSLREKRKKSKISKKEITLVILILFFVSAGAIALWISTFQMPDLSSLSAMQVSQSTKIYDRTGTVLLYDIHQNEKRTVVPFADISQNIKNATIAIEDPNFYTEGGIDIKSIVRSVFVDIFTLSFSQGGSTITQQVIKNSLLSNEKAISRKLKEWVLAIELERSMSKDDILSLYLNGNAYGGSIYGVEEAAQTFFGTSSANVDIAQAAYIAAIANAPTYYSPYGQNTTELDARKNLVLQKMLADKFITQSQYDEATTEKVTFQPQAQEGMLAPHFVEYIEQYLVNKYGEDAVDNDGFKVITTLDYPLQQQMQTDITNYAPTLAKDTASNAAAVAIDPKTGEILAMIGSENYFSTTTDGQFNVATALRQPGSTFKPFIYATAFEEGYTPDTVLFDVPTEFQTTCTPEGQEIDPNMVVSSSTACYMPQDFDGLYRGPVSLRSALALSLNIPSIQLYYLAGEKQSLDTAQSMGITTLSDDPTQYGLTLVLGGGEVSLLQMTSAYGVFANEGIKNPYTGILSVQDENGNYLEQFATDSSRVLPQNIADLMNNVLSDNVAKAPEYGMTDSPFMFTGREVAAKTGTTNDQRDVWTIGYTPDVVVGVWAGNNDNTPMVKSIAGLIVAPLWQQLMGAALASTSVDNFIAPLPTDPTLKPVLRGIWQGDDTYFIDTVSGKLATALTPPETKEEVAVPDLHSILYWVDKSDPTGPAPTNPAEDPQYNLWEYAVQKWLAANPQPMPVEPTQYDDVHTVANEPKVTLVSPQPNASYAENQRINVQFSATSAYPILKVNYYLNNQLVGISTTPPFTLGFVPSSVNNLSSTTNEFKAVIYDTVYNQTTVTVPITITQN